MLLRLTSAVILSSVSQFVEVQGANVPQSAWDQLKRDVGGRLEVGTPFAKPCFYGGFNSSACVTVQQNYLNEGHSYNCFFPAPDD
jgi:hypothetical protein